MLLFAPGGMRSRTEMWHSPPNGPPRVWNDWTEVLAKNHRVVAMDQRNAGRSRGEIEADHGWHTYAADQIALMDHLGIERCHTLGGCIGSHLGRQRTEQMSEELRDLLRAWSHEVELEIVESASGRNITEWAKKEGCWKAVKALALPIPAELPPELRSAGLRPSGRGRTREEITPRDLENIARCKEIDGATWLAIHAWGKDTGQLQKWQYGIAHTLSSYAASGWQRSPSPRQAKHAVIILEVAKAQGIL